MHEEKVDVIYVPLCVKTGQTRKPRLMVCYAIVVRGGF